MSGKPIKIIQVEDNPADARIVREMLVDEGIAFEMTDAGSLAEAVERLAEDGFDVALLDLILPDGRGLELFTGICRQAPEVPVVILTGLSDEALAIKAVQAGAQDYLVKGEVDGRQLSRAIRYAIERKRTEKASRLSGKDGIHSEKEGEGQFPELVGASQKFKEVMELVSTLARTTRTSVLIQSETGTGKELIANLVHYSSSRRDEPFIKLNCSSIPHTLLETEMFGYEKGAFTDAKLSKKGLLELADGGTIFLDEIGDMDISLQPKLLQFLENRTFRKIGGIRDMKVDVRVIAATNKDLESMVKEKRFREDLYYRLKVMVINMPPLKERKEDIIPLVEHFIGLNSKAFGGPVNGISPEAREILLRYPWPGNVRELRNVIERAVILAGGSEEILPEHLPQELVAGIPEPAATTPHISFIDTTLDELERKYILYVLDKVKGNKTRAANIIGISRPTLRGKLKKFGL